MSVWKSKRSIRCQLLPSKARTFQDWVGWESSHVYDPDISRIYNIHTKSCTHGYTSCEHRLTRETWAQRHRVTTSRKEKILEDRQGRFRGPDHRCQKPPLCIKAWPPLSRVSASAHSAEVWVYLLILSEWQKQQSCVCSVSTGETYLHRVTSWRENIRLCQILVERYNAPKTELAAVEERLQWLPASQIRMMSLAKQQSQQSQDSQDGSQGPALIYGLHVLFSHRSFYPI